MASHVCVVGSVNMDFVVSVPRFVQPGETLVGEEFDVLPGGKGANQAVAASRMGAQVSLVGCIGDDDWGSKMRGVLTAEGIDLAHVRTSEASSTGVGVIQVVPGGQRSIVVVPGANAKVTREQVEEARGAIAGADVLVLQGEIPLEANLHAIEVAKQAEKTVVLSAAPASNLSNELFARVDVLIVGREEAWAILGENAHEIAPSGLARRLASLGPDRVVMPLGAEGAVHFNGTEVRTFEGYPAEAIDATGAADAFVGALAVLRSEGARLVDAVRYACGARALATTVRGAIPSLPTREAVEALIGKSKVKS